MSNASEDKKDTRVLIGIDNSENCLNAFQYYRDHIYKPGHELILFHVSDMVHVPTWLFAEGMAYTVGDVRESVENLKKKNAKLEEKYVTKCKDSNITYKYVMVTEDPHGAGHAIVEAAKEHNAHLIVVGSRGMGALKRTLMGSVSTYVVHHGHVASLVVPSASKE